MLWLKQSTAVDVLIGPFIDSTDGYTAETGVSPSVKVSKNGQALAAKNDATTPTHDADGYYNCELDATDTNTVGSIVLTVAGSATSLPVRHEFQVVEEAVYAAFFEASANGVPAAMNNLSAADVNAEVDTALADYDGPTNAEMEARTLAATAYGTAANQTTLLGRLTATRAGYLDNLFAGTVATSTQVASYGDQTAGMLSLIARKDAAAATAFAAQLTTLNANGGAFDNATDSQEAIRDRGDTAWITGSGGTGGVADWTTDEKNQLRYRWGIDGTTAIPATGVPNIGAVAVTGNVTANPVTVTGNVSTNPVTVTGNVTANPVTVTGTVNANIIQVNSTTVTGNGASGSEWGPA